MKSFAKVLLITALAIGVPSGLMAQSVGNSDPAKADTSDPNSTPKGKEAKKAKAGKTAKTAAKPKAADKEKKM